MTEEDYQKERAAALERSKATDAHAHTLPEYWQLVGDARDTDDWINDFIDADDGTPR